MVGTFTIIRNGVSSGVPTSGDSRRHSHRSRHHPDDRHARNGRPSRGVHDRASGRAMMPGLVNGQAHGMPVGDRWPLELFLTAMSGRAGNRTLEDKYLNGLLAAVEMIRKGCTALQEW
jgi:hypothetical protein